MRRAPGPVALVALLLLTGCAIEPAPASAPLIADAETEEFRDQPPTELNPGRWAAEQEQTLLGHWNATSWEEAAVGISWAALVTDVRANEVGELMLVFEGSQYDEGVEQAADQAVQDVMFKQGQIDASLTSVAVMDTVEGRLFEWCTRSALTNS